MALYKGPEAGNNLDVKFVRISRNIYIGETLDDGHKYILEVANMLDYSDRLRIRENTEVDAGFMKLTWEEKTIYIGGKSGSLQLPIQRFEEEARERTLIDFSDQSPGFSVEKMDMEEIEAYYK